jgi:DNA-binding NarL/FixJ family response regulator
VIRVLVADDHALMRSGLRGMLDAEADIEVVGEAEDGAAAVDEAIRLHPDVVIMDIRMPRVDGIEATRRLMALGDAAPRILVLTTFDLDEYVFEALRAGAGGFMLKDAPPSQLTEGVRTVAAGESLLAPALTRRLIERYVKHPPADAVRRERFGDLTDRELEVVQLLTHGLSNAEIGDRLYLSEATVKTHVTRVLQKLGVRDRVQAVVLAYESGLVQPGSRELAGDERP